MLEVNKLRFGYSSKAILNDISFVVRPGEVVSLLGPNGTGKTTLLRCILGITKMQDGNVSVDGQNLSDMPAKQRARFMAYVPQSSALTFPYDVIEAVLMGRVPHLGFGSSPTQEDYREAREAMLALKIEHLAEKRFHQLSGGEKQLVLIARALAQQACFLIMDEPTASLDFSRQNLTLQIIRSLTRRGIAILMTTHSPDQAFYISDKVVMIKNGLVLADGPPDDVITAGNLSALYNMPTTVSETREHFAGRPVKVCVPLVEEINSQP